MRSIYEIRERPSRMYSWTALVTSQILVELPWNVLGSFILFITWYWTVGFDNSRAGYTFLMMVIAYPFYYTTFGMVSYPPPLMWIFPDVCVLGRRCDVSQC